MIAWQNLASRKTGFRMKQIKDTNETKKLFDKLESMPLGKLLSLCGLAIEENMEEKRLEMLLLLAETKITKYRMMNRLGLK